MMRVQATTSLFVKVLCFLAVALGCFADSFLARIPLEKVPEELKRRLLGEIEAVLGSEHRDGAETRFAPIENMLRPTFDAMPKNSFGKLDHAGVRYVLHRLFVQRHRWVINGQGSGDVASGSVLPAQALQNRVPEIVQELFEQRTSIHGSSLHEVALLAATLEHLVKNELSEKLGGVYKARNVSVNNSITEMQAEDFISLYMMGFIRGLDMNELSLDQVAWVEENINQLYPPWLATRQFLQKITREVAPNTAQLSFTDVAGIVAEIGDRFAEWQDSQCHVMKNMLLEIEDGGSGRVKLGDFYGAAINKGWYQFTETINYLRQIGTLDESDSSNPRVIIPNYVSGLSNCIARTQYYSVCCLDDCEPLFYKLEQELGKPEPTPAEVIAIVEKMPSATVTANRQISTQLRSRLNEIAQHHNGVIPMHGRLFAQWMHLVYPRECNYPHLSGTTYRKTMEEWEKETGERSGSTLDELYDWAERLAEEERLKQNSSPAASVSPSDGGKLEGEFGMWTMDEELFCERPPPHEQKKSSKSSLSHYFAILAFLTSLAYMMTSAKGHLFPRLR